MSTTATLLPSKADAHLQAALTRNCLTLYSQRTFAAHLLSPADRMSCNLNPSLGLCGWRSRQLPRYAAKQSRLTFYPKQPSQGFPANAVLSNCGSADSLG